MSEEKKQPKDVLKEYDVKKVKKAIKDSAIKQTEMSEHDQEIYRQMLKEADMPVEMKNADFKLGKQELDIRQLNEKNYRQMMFREQVLNNIYSKQTLSTLLDILRMLMVIATKLGVDDIVDATDELVEKLTKQAEEKAKKLSN